MKQKQNDSGGKELGLIQCPLVERPIFCIIISPVAMIVTFICIILRAIKDLILLVSFPFEMMYDILQRRPCGKSICSSCIED